MVLTEVLRLAQGDGDVRILFSDEKKIIKFTISDVNVYSRVIEGEFPPFERVIPTDFRTRVVLNREEFLRGIKMAAVFARDYSNVVVFEIKKEGFYLKPRAKDEKETIIYQEGEIEGEPQKIAFNYKFVLDFLVNIKGDRVILEITQPNAPAVFKINGETDFLHVIMPIRTEGESF